MPGKRLSFGPFVVDEGAQVILRDGEPLSVGNRGLQLLLTLLSRPGEVVTKSELMDAAWGGAAVEESNLSVQVANLRKALGTSPTGGDWIATIPRVGYRFVRPSEPPAAADPERPSIAVLPFDNLSADPEQGFFADGLAEEVITALSKLSGLRVAARNSSFAYRGGAADIRKVAAELSVSHVLSGSVRRSGDQLRMSVQLAEAAGGAQLWAERYDRTMDDIFAVQDEVTARVVDALRITLTPAEAAKPRPDGTADPEALDLFMRGRALLNGTTQNAEVFHRAIDLLNKAIEKDPDYADVYGQLTLAHHLDHANRWTADADRALERAREMAERRIALRPQSAEARMSLIMALGYTADDEAFTREAETALALDPGFKDADHLRGRLCIRRGDPLGAIPHFEAAMRRDPSLAATIFWLQMLGMAHLFGGRYETAAALFRERIVLMPETDWSRAYLIAALGHLGRAGDARKIHAELVAIVPDYRLDQRLARGPWAVPKQEELVLEGWRLAGIDPTRTG